MASYWPTPYATENDPIVAEEMNNLPKVDPATAPRWPDSHRAVDANDLVQAKVALSNIPNWLL
jgi:hypothetical protein